MSENNASVNANYGDKYRISSTRIPGYDYRNSNSYFVTICTAKWRWWFGTINSGRMKLSGIGNIARDCWQSIAKHYPNVNTDIFVIMPNHVHGIVTIYPHDNNCRDVACNVSKEQQQTNKDVACNVSKEQQQINKDVACYVSTDTKNNQTMSVISPKPGSLSAIVRSYKSAVTYQVRKSGAADFAWQPRFYEHIIRTEDSLERISDYIKTNPEFWTYDIENQNDISIDLIKILEKQSCINRGEEQ